MMRPSHRAAATLAAALLLSVTASAARAATFTVQPGAGPCDRSSDTACGTLGEAAAAVEPGDAVNVAPATYTESPTFEDGGISITGGAGVTVSGGLRFTGGGTAPVTLERLVVGRTASAGAPAIEVSGAAGLVLRDSVVVSTVGPAMAVSASERNLVQRATVVSTAADGVLVTSADNSPAPKALTAESSILIGEAGAAGLAVRTGDGAPLPISQAGDVSVTLRHVTIAGSAKGVELDASRAHGPPALLLAPANPAGNIAASVVDSIVLGTGRVATDGPSQTGADNTATLTVDAARNLVSGDPAALFVNPGGGDFHLRADSPALDRGGAPALDESATDIDGGPRVTGAASDLGADEFVNRPPTAALAVDAPTRRQNQPVRFDASHSLDPEAAAGGGIVGYGWTFGDGRTQFTPEPTVEHAYRAEGPVTASVVAVDRQGAVSEPAVTMVSITDGTPPAVAITNPSEGQIVLLTRSRTRTRRVRRNGRTVRRRVTTKAARTVRFEGTAVDRSGVRNVVLALQQDRADRKPRKRRSGSRRRRSSSSQATCRWYDPARGVVARSCSQPAFFEARVSGTRWTFTLPRTKRPAAGRYRLFAFGVDRTGVSGNVLPADGQGRPVVRLRLR